MFQMQETGDLLMQKTWETPISIPMRIPTTEMKIVAAIAIQVWSLVMNSPFLFFSFF